METHGVSNLTSVVESLPCHVQLYISLINTYLGVLCSQLSAVSYTLCWPKCQKTLIHVSILWIVHFGFLSLSFLICKNGVIISLRGV